MLPILGNSKTRVNRSDSVLIAHYIPESLHSSVVKFSPAGTNFIDKLRSAWGELDLCIIRIQSNGSKIFTSRVLKDLPGTCFVFRTIFDLMPYKFLWFYNVPNKSTLVLALLLKLMGKRIYLLNADYNKSTFLGNFLLRTVNIWGGIMSLSYVGTLGHKNSIVSPGILSSITFKNRRSKNNNVIFSGQLTLRHGVDLLVEVAEACPEYTFHVAGLGITESQMARFVATKNCIFHGYLPKQDYQSLLNECTYALSLRNPAYVENEGEFPSKIFEFLERSMFVIATGMDSRYQNIDCVLSVGYTCEEVADAIRSKSFDSRGLGVPVNLSSEGWLGNKILIECNG